MPAELLFALPFIGALLLALALPFGGLLQYHLAGKVSPETRVMLLLGLMTIGSIVGVLFTTRTLDEAEMVMSTAREAYEDASDGFITSRLFSVFVVGAGFIEIVRGWLRSRRAELDPARSILIAMLGLYVGTIVIQATVSDVPSFTYKNFYPLVALVAIYYQRVENLPRVIRLVKLVILLLMLGSLLAAIVKPDFVLQRPAPSLLPGIKFRFYGLTPHANTIGPIALLGIVLELAYPSRFFARWPQLISCAIVFVLAQSKTAWVAGVLMIPFVILPLAMLPSADRAKRGNDFNRSVSALLVVIGLAVCVAIGLGRFDIVEFLNRRIAGLDTLVGRTRIWQITLDAWRDNVLFGYGAEIWGIERRVKFGMLFAGQAHNQFIQTLGDSGLVGLLLLLTYLGVLLRVSIKYFAASRGVMVAVLIIILVRCITEAPMRAVDLLSWPLLTHLVLVIMACHYMRRPAVESVREERPSAPARPRIATRRPSLPFKVG